MSLPAPCTDPRVPRDTARPRPWQRPAGLALGLAASLALLGGCAVQAPSPWEKGLLAKPEMTMAGDALGQRFDAHIYTSKEAASGGSGVGGGGCGCN